uniref:Uncharacterized protein n=1 Tax=Anguilla anguilla TaxID=7936 RepID=A0A0E9TBU5_ANGAN
MVSLYKSSRSFQRRLRLIAVTCTPQEVTSKFLTCIVEEVTSDC